MEYKGFIMRVNTNVAALQAQESAQFVNGNLNKSLEKLSSGLRINKASDDASGLAIADKLRTQASSISQAVDNSNSAVAMMQIADKAMSEQSNILDIIKQKLIQASTATTSTEGREAIRKDITKLAEQFDNIAQQTNYNGIYLLQGSATDKGGASEQSFQIGGEKNTVITIKAGIQSNSTGEGYEVLQSIVDLDEGGLKDASVAQGFLDGVDTALNKLNEQRAEFGSSQIQLESATRNLMTQETNIKAAESVIRDVDYAAESAHFSQQNIIAQAGTYAASQANTVQQNVLRLLQ
jgi:flagellin